MARAWVLATYQAPTGAPIPKLQLNIFQGREENLTTFLYIKILSINMINDN